MIVVVLALVALSVLLQIIGERRASAMTRRVGITVGLVGVAVGVAVDAPADTRLVTGILAAALIVQVVAGRSRRGTAG